MTATVKPLHARRTPGIKTKQALQSMVGDGTPPAHHPSPRQSTAGVSSSSGGAEGRARIQARHRVAEAGTADALQRPKPCECCAAGVEPGPLTTYQSSGKAVVHPGEGNDGASNGPLDPFLVRLGIWWIGIGAPARITLLAVAVWLALGLVAAVQ